MGYLDAHCHLAKSPHPAELIARAREAGIDGWVQGGISPEDWEGQRRLRSQNGARIITCFGLHPWFVGAATEGDWRALEAAAPEADAIGETGLDLQPRHAPSAERQRGAFRRHLELAARLDKPLILHIVRAHAEALEMLRDFSVRGIVHSFGACLEIADQYLKLGLILSIGPSIRREGSKNFKKAVMSLPLERLAIETDAPDQTPESADLIGIADIVAGLRGETREAVLAASSRNLEKLFGKRA